MKAIIAVLAIALAGCVAPAAGASACSITAHEVQQPGGRVIEVDGQGWMPNDPLTIGWVAPSGQQVTEVPATEGGSLQTFLWAADDGTYTIGPVTGQSGCSSNTVTLTLAVATTKPVVTLPPKPVVTIPPTDTE